jgi:hypothetical protein
LSCFCCGDPGRGEITSQEFFDAWDEQMAENERLHPGIHDRLYEYLMKKYPGLGVDADEFFGLKDPPDVPSAEQTVSEN